jgi:polyisoprenoid-binding protein YceI
MSRKKSLDTSSRAGPRPYGNQRAGFTATTQISRSDFGVNFNGLLETGGVVVSDKVKITLHIEAIRAD